MLTVSLSPEFRRTCPLFAGALVLASVRNSPSPPALLEEMEAWAEKIRSSYDTSSIKLRPGIHTTRQAYKSLGKDPSRYRPACEQLARRVLQGKWLYSINTVVDLVNIASLFCGYATAALDQDRIEGETLTLGIGREGEPYEAIGRGQLNVERLPIYRDELGGIATPTSDNVRTMVSLETHRLAVLINAYDGDRRMLEETTQLVQELLCRYACSDGGEVFFY